MFQVDNLLSKYFRDIIQQYNSILAFTSLKYTPDPRLLLERVQNFQIHRELDYMQRYIIIELHDNNFFHYAQLYFYDPILL